MYTEEDLVTAVGAGILTEETANAFRAHVARLRNAAAIDDEQFRLVTGFNDIFVVIACVLVLASVAWLVGGVAPWVGALSVSAVAWGLGEFFIRKRRLALPAIVLLLAFTGGIVATGLLAHTPASASIAIACAAAAIATWLHWRRFHVPITVAAGAATAVGCIIALAQTAAPGVTGWTNALSFASGCVVFAIAMRWDSADPQRQTRKSDVAFWLHLLAAPLLVRPVFAVLGVFAGATDLRQAIIVVAIYIAIAIVSLSIDRRALMVSALFYVLYTFADLLRQYGVVASGFAIVGVIIGSGLLLLSAFWHPARVRVLGLLPPGLRSRLPPLR